jgi:MerR family transcriptional regulator, thiopeptide resistance regulator
MHDHRAMSDYKVGQVTRLSGVSVRTLHHYDEIGLLVPSGRSDAGYRLYSAADLSRLRRILFYRELDFSLEQIAEILADPGVGAEGHLRRQHRLLRERLARTQALLEAIETEMEAQAMGISLTPEEQLEVFGTDQVPEWQREAKDRWGDTEAWRESQRRTATYTKEDWIEITGEAGANQAAFVGVMRSGAPADGEQAMDLAEAHRRHICRWFYECDHRMHGNLAEMYVADPRFRESYERQASGLAAFVHDAILANLRRHGG